MLGSVAHLVITDEQAETQLQHLKEQEAKLREELYGLTEQIGNLPSQDDLRICLNRVKDHIFLYDDQGNTYAGGNDVQSYRMMTDEDRRRLIGTVFAQQRPSGKPAGSTSAPIPLDGEAGRGSGVSSSGGSWSLRKSYQRIKI